MSETFRTELVINNMATGGGTGAPDMQAMVDNIVRKHLITADPKRDLAEAAAEAGIVIRTRDLLNSLGAITNLRASQSVVLKGQQMKIHKMSPTGEPLYNEEGEPVYETHTPQVRLGVKADPNVHKTDRQLALEQARVEEIFSGKVTAPTQEEIDKATTLKAAKTATAEDIEEADDIIRRFKATQRKKRDVDPAAEVSKYEKQALKDIEKIERDITSTRKRVNVSALQERLDAANRKIGGGFLARIEGAAIAMTPGARELPTERKPLSPEDERARNFLNLLAGLDAKLNAFQGMSPEAKQSPEGKMALADIKAQSQAMKSDTDYFQQQQKVQQEQQARQMRDQANMNMRMMRGIATSTGSVFDPNKSFATTGLLSVGSAAGETMMQAGAMRAAAGGSAAMMGWGALILGGVNLLKGAYERGTELQKSAEKIYTAAEPMFAREEQMRAARGDSEARALVRSFSPQAERRALAAQQRIGMPQESTAGSGRPANADVYSELATERFNTIQQFLGSSMGFGDAVRAYSQFRRQSGVVDMTTAQAAEAMRTGMLAGVPSDMLASASRLGAIQGNIGGGFRRGLDERLDIGTLRFQMETMGRAGLTGAPAEAILGQTLQRQESFAAAGLRTNFDRDAMFQRVLQERGIAPEQFGGITGTLDDMRMGVVSQLQAPGREIMSGLMMVNAFMKGKTVTGAAEYAAKTSSAEQLEEQLKLIGPASGLIPLVSMGLAPADQTAMSDALKRIREGQTAGPAAATGEGTADEAAQERGRFEFMPEYSAIGAQRSMGRKSEISQFQASLDGAAKAVRAAADAMQAAAASAASFM